MTLISVNFQLSENLTSQRPFWQHAFYCCLDNTLWSALDQFIKCDATHVTNIAGVLVISLVFGFITSNSNFFSIHNNNVITRINVWCKFWLVLSTQAMRDLS